MTEGLGHLGGSNTEILPVARSWYVPSIQMMGGIVPLTRRRRRCPAYANIPGLRSPRLRRGRPRAVLSRSRNGGPKTPICRAMDKVLGWARVWFAVKREDDAGLL